MPTINTRESSTTHNKNSITNREQTEIERIQSGIDVEKTFTFTKPFDTVHVDSKETID